MEIILFFAGVFFGIGIASIVFTIRRTTGILKIDHSNPDKDVYRFEIDDLEKLHKKTRVVLKIDHHADLSQK